MSDNTHTGNSAPYGSNVAGYPYQIVYVMNGNSPPVVASGQQITEPLRF